MQINYIEGFKKIIIIFWMLWWFIALWTDIVGAMAHAGLLTKSWAQDLNYPFLVQSLKIYPIPDWLPVLLFLGILLWSFVATIAFFWACMSLHKNSAIWMKRADIAFVISITYWLAFFLSDQIVMKFDLEENHMVQGGFQLLTYLTLYLLPSEKRTSVA
ncbi:Uncharacterised protein [Legionella lansingensis]|uniref:Transmembrane protein n=1 Tax=Legionella lansingensis TaxID=45067 RepID=A0A0W0VUJ6_9GAMM|nr:hypothetical protein [Legionella lansingensis]KTD23879.1 hypothetical protein Llan_0660 [Legionella lansingensis]SNV46518.1 Uncharacterised protein [Legionella lansingensis]